MIGKSYQFFFLIKTTIKQKKTNKKNVEKKWLKEKDGKMYYILYL